MTFRAVIHCSSTKYPSVKNANAAEEKVPYLNPVAREKVRYLNRLREKVPYLDRKEASPGRG